MQGFSEFIIECCRLPEWELRDFLKERLVEAGFSYIEDDYRSKRGGKYNSVHNLLFRRGEAPKVCFVAHTDVCRDHGWRSREYTERGVLPVIKTVSHYGKHATKIIQDKTCEVQVGGDDRCGVAIITWLAINTGYDMGLLFTTDEEIGLVSAREVRFPEINDFELLCQIDRGNRERQLVISIGGRQIIETDMALHLLKIAEDMDLPRDPVVGLVTDIYAIQRNYGGINAVNMSCGYHNNEADNEYIVISEAWDTVRYCSQIAKDFNLREGAIPEYSSEEEEEDIKDAEEEILREMGNRSAEWEGSSEEEEIVHIEWDLE